MSGAFPFQVVAAPLAGISGRAWREIARCYGADLAVGEMVSARALAYGNKRTLELLDIAGEAPPVAVQISGSEPEFVARAARLAVSLGADYLDLNMGCPVPKVVGNHEGAALMRDPALAARLIEAARTAGRPVSVKFRAGWDQEQLNAVEFARMAQQAGAAFLTVHGRTRDQFYGGRADWGIIAQVKQAVTIPVIGNGDVFSAKDALNLLAASGCDGVMVGRGGLGNPWLFREISAAFKGQPPPPRPEPQQIVAQALAHLKRQVQLTQPWVAAREKDEAGAEKLAEALTVRALRGQLGWYTRGLRHAARLRMLINQLTTVAEIEALFQDYLHSLAS